MQGGAPLKPDRPSKPQKPDKPGKPGKPPTEASVEVLIGAGDAPSPDEKCGLPESSELVNVWGVPGLQEVTVGLRLPRAAGSDLVIGVQAVDRGIAETYDPPDYPPGKVYVTVAAGDTESSRVRLRANVKVGQTGLAWDGFWDIHEDPTIEDWYYPPQTTPVVVWHIDAASDVVDYNALGTEALRCYDPDQSPALHANIGNAVTCGATANAVSADGLSLQLLRLQAGGPGRACYAIRYPSDPGVAPHHYYGRLSDSVASGAELDVDAGNIATIEYQDLSEPEPSYWAFGTYSPPTDFVDVHQADRQIEIDVWFMPLGPEGTYVRSAAVALPEPIKLTIRRPPVVFVHGLNSSSRMWKKAYRPWNERADGKQRAFYFDYERSNVHPFQFNAERLEEYLRDSALVLQRRARTAVTQVDIVAHSMGGLITRTMIDQATQRPGDDYRRPENFYAGDIRRLLTLATPYKGSKIANLVINLHEHYPHIHEFGVRLRASELALLDSLGSTAEALHNGAICDLAESSAAVEFAAVPEVYGIAHAGIEGLTDGLTFPVEAVAWAFLSEMQVAVNPYILTAPNDGLVEIGSAEGNLPRWHSGTVVEHPYFHSDEFIRLADFGPCCPPGQLGPGLGIASRPSVARQVRDALDTPEGWEPLPAIVRESAEMGVPVTGGRGLIDHVSWLNQCAPGGPLNRMGD
jgi:pimeloyl-ACP methyl ester carboxylesterase